MRMVSQPISASERWISSTRSKPMPRGWGPPSAATAAPRAKAATACPAAIARARRLTGICLPRGARRTRAAISASRSRSSQPSRAAAIAVSQPRSRETPTASGAPASKRASTNGRRPGWGGVVAEHHRQQLPDGCRHHAGEEGEGDEVRREHDARLPDSTRGEVVGGEGEGDCRSQPACGRRQVGRRGQRERRGPARVDGGQLRERHPDG